MVKIRLYWDSAYPIALRLKREHENVDPTRLDYQTLRDWVMKLDDFADEPQYAQMTMLDDIIREWTELII